MSRVYVSVLVAIMAAVAVAVTENQGSMHDCAVAAACAPSSPNSNHACQRKLRMDLRFTMDQAYSHWKKEVNASGALTSVQSGVPYFFCPVVDELAAYSLNHSISRVLLDKHDKWDVSDMEEGSGYQVMDPKRKYLNITVFGMGQLPLMDQPQPEDDSYALIVEQNSTMCPALTKGTNWPHIDLNNTRQSAVVHFLVLNITTTLGEYKYESGTSLQPIQSGFMSTCDETDRCKLFDDGVCIGLKKGKKNCAKCVESPGQALDHANNLDLKIWSSFYGTDKTGRKMMSGSENPLSFTQFSAEPVFKKVGGELGSIERKV